MLPDLAVLLLKTRDYVLWMLPAYLAGVLLTTAAALWLERQDPTGYAATRAMDPGTAPESAPTRDLAARLAAGDGAGALWILALGWSVTPLGLALAALFTPALALLRLGLGLALSAALALVAARARPIAATARSAGAAEGSARSVGTLARARAGGRAALGVVDHTAGPLLASAALGALLTAWPPALVAVRALAGAGPAAGWIGALAGFALPLPAGGEAPLVRALITYDAPTALAVALLLAAPLLNWRRLHVVRARYGARAAAGYAALGLALSGAAGALAGIAFDPLRLFGF